MPRKQAASRAPERRRICDDPEKAEQVSEVLKAVAHPLRVRIIPLLCQGPKHVNELSECLKTRQAIVSQQLRILRMRRLVAATRTNGHALYRIEEPQLHELIACMERCSH